MFDEPKEPSGPSLFIGGSIDGARHTVDPRLRSIEIVLPPGDAWNTKGEISSEFKTEQYESFDFRAGQQIFRFYVLRGCSSDKAMQCLIDGYPNKQDSNYRISQAAPELLQALEAMCIVTHAGGGLVPEIFAAIGLARAAIKKAKGLT